MKFIFNINNWVNQFIDLLNLEIKNAIDRNGLCNILLTGGRTAKILYENLALSEDFNLNMPYIHFYFGDERCVEIDSQYSIFNMAKKTLFTGHKAKLNIYRIPCSLDARNYDHKLYEELLPENMDIGLFSVGLDGHIASIFPGEDFTMNQGRTAVVEPKNHQHKRVTITPNYIKNISKVFVLSIGREKQNLYNNALKHIGDEVNYPAGYLAHKIWVTTK
jgi:6-phosphogluconolactonase